MGWCCANVKNLASRVPSLFALSTMPRPGHRFQTGSADRLSALFTDPKSLLPNPPQGILYGSQELAVCLVQPDLRGGTGLSGSHRGWIPPGFAGGGNRARQALADREFLLVGEKKGLVAKKLAPVHDHNPLSHLCGALIVHPEACWSGGWRLHSPAFTSTFS